MRSPVGHTAMRRPVSRTATTIAYSHTTTCCPLGRTAERPQITPELRPYNGG
ncbi:hypothetical protein PI125_g16610 [Phytophthora idaei]|nr:hypothetical protein PI125_g16610 [Phytophthora idaei]